MDTIKYLQLNLVINNQLQCLDAQYLNWFGLCFYRVHEMCQSCQTWPAKFGQILLRTDTRLVFCNRKLMRTDFFYTRTTKPICNFVNSVISVKCHFQQHFYYIVAVIFIGGENWRKPLNCACLKSHKMVMIALLNRQKSNCQHLQRW